MSDFSALIKARLNLEGIDSDIKSINEKQVHLNNVKVDTSSIISQIQNALNKQKFNINLDTSKVGGVGIGSDKAIKGTTSAYRELMSVTKQIGKLEINLGKLSSTKNGNEIVTITNQLNTLKDRYVELRTQLQGGLSIEQNSALTQQIVNIESEFERLDAKLADTKQNLLSTLSANVADGGSVGKSVAAVTAQYERLGTTGHSQLTVVKTDIEELRSLQESMKTATGDELVNQYSRFEQTLSRVRNNLATISAESKTFVSSLQITTLDNKIATWMERNTRASKDFGVGVQELRTRLAELNASGKATTSQLNAIEREFNELKQSAIAAGKVGQTFGSIFRQSFTTVTRYISSAQLIYRAISAMKEMYQNVVNIDTAMTGLYRVTNLTEEGYSNLFNQMKESAKEYGVTLKDIVDLTTSWVKLGFDTDTAEGLAEITAQYQHVTDLDVGTATKNLITAYKGFQEELNDVYRGNTTEAVSYISDIYDKLGNEFALSAADVGAAMQRSASALSEANNTIQESTGLATGMIEVIQNAEKAGTVLQTTSLRLRGMKGELEELGEEVDEDVESISQMQTHILNLTNGKVNIFEDNGDFKSTYQILKEISEVYDSLSDTAQADLLESVAGKRNANAVAAVISNFDQVEKATEAATIATGTAENEQAKYMKSIQGHLNQLQASWESFSSTVIDSNFLKGIIDSGKTVLEILGAIIGKFGMFPTLLAGIATTLIVKNVGRDKMSSLFLNVPTIIVFYLDINSFLLLAMKYIVINEGAICWELGTPQLLPHFGNEEKNCQGFCLDNGVVTMLRSKGQQG